jgi:hypothetical protein
MNLNLGINPPQSKEAETLYKLAYQCVHSHTTVHCNVCATCAYNIDRYGWEPNQVRLIKASALVDYQQAIVNDKNRTKQFIKSESTIMICIIIMVLFLFIGVGFIDAQPTTIEEATTFVKDNLRDVNFDKKINCIDYAVIFYEVWPNARMMHIYNFNGFSHLLNKVGDTYIEPRVSNGDPLLLWSKEWYTVNVEDETDKWSWWATRKQW